MTALTLNHMSAGRKTGFSLKDFFFAAIEGVAHEMETRKAIKKLNAYSDRELADIGLSRSQIESAVRHGR